MKLEVGGTQKILISQGNQSLTLNTDSTKHAVAITGVAVTWQVDVTAPITNSGSPTNPILGVTFGTTANTIAQGDDSRIVGAQQKSEKNQPSGYAGLDSSGLVLGSLLPPIAISNTTVVSSQAAMLALTAEVGDIAVRTDLSKTFILTQSPASTVGNWQEILVPPDAVTSVAGRVGNVTLSNTDISGLGNSSTRNVGTTAGTVAAGDDARLSDTRTPTDGTVTDAKIATTLSPSKITGTAVVTGDSRLSDSRTPTAHASSHGSGGSDPITIAETQVTNLTADLAGKLSSSDSRLSVGVQGVATVRAISGSGSNTTVSASDHTHTATGDVTGTLGASSAALTIGSGAVTLAKLDSSTIKLNTIPAAVANVDISGFKITSLGDPSSATDAANKQYVDNNLSGLNPKGSAKLATTGSDIGSLSGAKTIDGVAVTTGDVILVKDQTSSAQNGTYVANTSGAWTRTTDMDSWNEFKSAYVFVTSGSVNSSSSFLVNNWTAGGTVGTTGITFGQFSSSANYTAGNGILKTGSQFSAVAYNGITVDGNGISVNPKASGGITVDATGVSLTNKTISGVSLGGNLFGLTIGTGLSGSSYNGSAGVTIAIDSTVATLTGAQSLTNKAISGASNTLTNIANSSLVNSKVTIGTTDLVLGAAGSTTIAGLSSVTSAAFIGALTGNADTATKLSTPRAINGVNFDGSAGITITAAAGTLTGTTLNSTVVSSSINKIGLSSAGFVKTDASGSLSVDSNAYLTGNQSITLSGDISGSGTTAITTAIGAGKVTNAMLAGGIDLTTKVTGTLPVGNLPVGTGSTNVAAGNHAHVVRTSNNFIIQGNILTSGTLGIPTFFATLGFPSVVGIGQSAGTMKVVKTVCKTGAGTVDYRIKALGLTYLPSDALATGNITVNDASAFPSIGGLIQIDNEIISYTGISSNTFTGCTRGYGVGSGAAYSTAASTHLSGAKVHLILQDAIRATTTKASNALATPIAIADETEVELFIYGVSGGQNLSVVTVLEHRLN